MAVVAVAVYVQYLKYNMRDIQAGTKKQEIKN